MKYAKEGYNSSNDAQALMNYAQSLKIFEELKNKRGQGIIHNNLGNLHMKNERIDEALDAYFKAVESIALNSVASMCLYFSWKK